MNTIRWARFQTHDGRTGFGRLEQGGIAEYAGNLFDAPRASGVSLADGAFTLLAPCTPTKMIALWNNFGALAAKLGKQVPAHPLFLIKPATCIIGSGEPIRRPRHYSGKVAFEGELGIVIRRRCKDVDIADAARVITRSAEVERQNHPLSDRLMSPVEIVSRVSCDMTLLAGDVIACGTSLGVGPIRDGATVDITIDGIGTLSNAFTA